MSVHKSGDFISDVERQFEWYAVKANWEIAERYFNSDRKQDFPIHASATGGSS